MEENDERAGCGKRNEPEKKADDPAGPGSDPGEVVRDRRPPKRVKFAAAPAEMAGKYDTEDGHCAQECRGIQPVRMTGRRQLTAVTPADIRMLEHELGEENQPSLDRLKRRVGLLPLRQMVALGWLKAEAAQQQDKNEAGNQSTSENGPSSTRMAPVGRPGGLQAVTFRSSH